MAVQIKVDFSGSNRIVARVKRGYSPATIIQWAKTEAHNVARDAFAQNFATEGKRLGKKWQPLASRTVKDRTRLGYGGTGPMLVRRGGLKSKVLNSKPSIRTGSNEISVIWGEINDVKYLANQGGSSRNLPARPMIAANKTDATNLTRSLRSHMTRAMSNV